MTTVNDIIAQRDVAVGIIVKQIIAANDFKNAGAQGMDDRINTLEQQKEAIAAQAYQAALDDPSMTQALAALKAATQHMNAVASNMVTATTFIANLSGFLTAASKIIPILQNTG